jgi:hypothetical protein
MIMWGNLVENIFKTDVQRQQNIFTVGTKPREATGRVIFALLQTTAKKSDSYTDGDRVNLFTMKPAELLLQKDIRFLNPSLSLPVQ